MPGRGGEGHLAHALLGAKAAVYPHGIGHLLDAGAKAGEARSPLVDPNLEAQARQENTRSCPRCLRR
jgi:hypothetical protein